ncbi:hypothetical protein O3G_MSEX011917 [Manduca sexta]|nr:hypothetical protein O3G_MSEX011917 [Manduca sexta]
MPLPAATLINIRGTREILHLAKQCSKLRVFVYVSTAYCCATTDKIGVQLEEEFHPCSIPPATLIDIVEKVDTARVEAIVPGLMESWPNTYTFTKAITEQLVRSMADEIPICVIRPPIVIGTYNEPAPGWVDMSCANGPSGIIIGHGLGILRVMYTREDKLLCLVPGDYANNCILAAAWDCVERRKSGDEDVKIFSVSSTKSGVQLRTLTKNLKQNDLKKYSPRQSIWYCQTYITDNKLLYHIFSWFMNYLPAMIVDLIINVFQIPKPKGITSFVTLYKKVDKLALAFRYFTCNGWRFNDKNIVELHQKMSPMDQKIFNVDTSTINWDHMIFIWFLGVKKFILKESKLIDDYAIRKQKVFKVANYAVFFIYLYVFYYIFYSLYSYFK